MLCTRLIVFAAMALLFAQLQCAAACAGHLCSADPAKSDSVPPCHRHHGSHNPAPASCPHQTLVAAAPALPMLPAGMPVSSVSLAAAAALILPIDARASALDFSAFSPPGFESLSSVVLRI